MNLTQWRLWLADVKTELKDWSRSSLLIWSACLVGSLLFFFLSIAAKNNTQQALAQQVFNSASANSALGNTTGANSVEKAANSSEQQLQIAQEPQELVILDTQDSPSQESLKRLSETALTLHSSLQSGSESEASYASRAGRVAGVAVAMRQSQLPNSEASFWRPISESIAALEQGVRLGEIDGGQVVALVTELRKRYVDLRLGKNSFEQSALSSNAEAPVEPIKPIELEQVTDKQPLEVLGSSESTALPLSLRLLPWLSALLPLGCLWYGINSLLSRMRKRHEAYPKKGYVGVASTQSAQQMTAAAAPANRHAAERKTQAAILQLLDEMEPLAEGDLTHEASVTEDLTGALADSFNHSVHELRRLVKQINRSSDLVKKAVTESRERTLLMARQGAVQAREVSRTNERLVSMRTDVVSLSANSQQVAEYAHKVAARTQHAAKAVTQTRDALAIMRSQADSAERSIERLVQSTKGIEARLSDIKSAAKRTDLLALNSTIHAASRQEAVPELSFDGTNGFASGNTETFSELATDVSSLAGQLKTATGDIDQLSDVIRDEAGDSLRAVRETVSQVKKCEVLSEDAKAHLDHIAKAAYALGVAVTEVSNRTAVQAKGVTELANTTNIINNITHDTATALTQAVNDLQHLENMSNSLEASVHGFRLPEEPVK